MVTTPKQQFIHFLKENNAYEEFMFNFTFNSPVKINFIKYINNTPKTYYIYQGFDGTKQKEVYKNGANCLKNG